jgi:hypothetical protein
MTINKSTNLKTFDEGVEFVKKLQGKEKQPVRITFNGVIDNTTNTGDGFRVDWIDEE